MKNIIANNININKELTKVKDSKIETDKNYATLKSTCTKSDNKTQDLEDKIKDVHHSNNTMLNRKERTIDRLAADNKCNKSTTNKVVNELKNKASSFEVKYQIEKVRKLNARNSVQLMTRKNYRIRNTVARKNETITILQGENDRLGLEFEIRLSEEDEICW